MDLTLMALLLIAAGSSMLILTPLAIRIVERFRGDRPPPDEETEKDTA